MKNGSDLGRGTDLKSVPIFSEREVDLKRKTAVEGSLPRRFCFRAGGNSEFPC